MQFTSYGHKLGFKPNHKSSCRGAECGWNVWAAMIGWCHLRSPEEVGHARYEVWHLLRYSIHVHIDIENSMLLKGRVCGGMTKKWIPVDPCITHLNNNMKEMDPLQK
jgi:hypothetical protein